MLQRVHELSNVIQCRSCHRKRITSALLLFMEVLRNPPRPQFIMMLPVNNNNLLPFIGEIVSLSWVIAQGVEKVKCKQLWSREEGIGTHDWVISVGSFCRNLVGVPYLVELTILCALQGTGGHKHDCSIESWARIIDNTCQKLFTLRLTFLQILVLLECSSLCFHNKFFH
jgi:hypothetical protein